MSVASLILGIVAIVAGIFGLGIPVGAICGLVGIILGAMARRDPEKAGLGTAGMVCSIIGFILSVLFFIACTACVGGLAGGLGSLLD